MATPKESPCSQWLTVQVETNEWCSSSACNGTSTFTVFINDIASGIAGCSQSLRKFADDTNLSGAVDNAQGEGCHPEGLCQA